MGYQNILVHVSLVGNEKQVGLALALAQQFNAHLTGICVLPDAAMLRSAAQNPFIRLNKTEVLDIIEREYDEARQSNDNTMPPQTRLTFPIAG